METIEHGFIRNAAKEGDEAALRTLLEVKAVNIDIDDMDDKRRTAVWWAAHNGHVEVVKVLHKLGANLDIPEKAGTTPVLTAVQNGDVEMVRVLGELGANVDTPMKNAATPLFIAAQEGNVEVVRVLGELDANMETPNEEGFTPLAIASHAHGMTSGAGHYEVINLLEERLAAEELQKKQVVSFAHCMWHNHRLELDVKPSFFLTHLSIRTHPLKDQIEYPTEQVTRELGSRGGLVRLPGGAVVSFPSNPNMSESINVQIAQVDATSIPGLGGRQTASLVLKFRDMPVSKPAIARLPHSAGNATVLEVRKG